MKVITKWEKEKLRFISNNELNKSINMDGHEDIGGEDSAMTPMEILLRCKFLGSKYPHGFSH